MIRRVKKLTGLASFCIVFIMLVMSDPAAGKNLLRAPENPSAKTPQVLSKDKEVSRNILNKILSAPIVFYRKSLSSCWGRKCSHEPSCSRYGLMAIKKHGPLVGFVMTFDRLQHESNEAKFSRLVKINGETKVFDPVENNDFWWYKNEKTFQVDNQFENNVK